MKRTAVLLFVVMLPCVALGQNLLTNPEFTANTMGWTGTNLGHNLTDGNSRAGCAEVAKDFGEPDPIIAQCVVITSHPVGTRFVFGAWIKAVDYDPHAADSQPVAQLNYFTDTVCGSRVGEDGGAQGWPTHEYGIWQRYAAAGKLPPGVQSVLLQVGMYRAPDEPTSITRIDDAFLQVGESPGGLVHLWPFNGNADDVIGGADGAITGSPSYVQGALGLALDFNGIEEYVTAAADINPATMPMMTMGAWVIPGDVIPIRTVISHDNGGYDRTLGIDSRGPGALVGRYMPAAAWWGVRRPRISASANSLPCSTIRTSVSRRFMSTERSRVRRP